eukprot:15366119-Ditylum_brightwellii.AAC.1
MNVQYATANHQIRYQQTNEIITLGKKLERKSDTRKRMERKKKKAKAKVERLKNKGTERNAKHKKVTIKVVRLKK